MQRLSGVASFIPVEGNKNEYEIHMVVKGFQNYESVKRFKRSKKRLCFCEGLLFLIAGGIVVTLVPDEQMINKYRIPLEARRLFMLQHDQGRRVGD